MKNSKLFFIFIISIFVCFILGCGSSSNLSEKIPNFDSLSVVEKTYFVETDINYPQFTESTYEKMNSSIRKYLDSDYKSFKSAAKKFFNESSTVSNYSMSFDISRSKNILSVLLTIRFYTGGAHFNYSLKSFNFDIDKQIFLNIMDVTGLSLNELSKECQKLVKEKNDDYSPNGLSPKIENFNNFMVNGNDVVVYFEPYQVACFAAGIVNVTLPKKM